MENSKSLIKAGKLIEDGMDYVTDEGVRISRVYLGKRGTTIKWKREGDGFYYRGLYEAYYKLQY